MRQARSVMVLALLAEGDTLVNVRNYGTGVVNALISLGKGTCYYPGCSEPLSRFVDGVPVNNFETAHIRALNQGGPRFTEGLTQDEANRIGNLVLLCLVHHKIVDKLRPEDFPISVLLEWKSAREAASYGELQGLRELTEDRLQELMTGAFDAFREQLDAAISKLEGIDQGVAAMVRPLADDYAEAAFVGHFPSEDTATTLGEAAMRLETLHDTASILSDTADKLAGLQDMAVLLADAAKRLEDGQQFM